jgi:hypothetical protein
LAADGSSALVADAKPYRLWFGPEPHEGTAAYQRARRAGMSVSRALVMGEIGSFPDCWKFQRTIARILGLSVRTVQRAVAQAKALGQVRVHRSKKGEIPPRGPKKGHADDCDCFSCKPRPLPCGWSHKWAVGRGLVGAAVLKAITAARLRFISRVSISATRGPAPRVTSEPSPSTSTAPSTLTQAQIDRELAEIGPHVSARVRAELERRWKRPRDGPED